MQDERTKKPGTAKADVAPEAPVQSASVWGTHAKWPEDALSAPPHAPPPPDWTRYVDSRLKQFCTR